LDLLYYKASEFQQAGMIEFKKYRAFQLAASNGHLSCVTLLCSWVKKKEDLVAVWKDMVSTLKPEDKEKDHIKKIEFLIPKGKP
jgi:hypothetical protein